MTKRFCLGLMLSSALLAWACTEKTDVAPTSEPGVQASAPQQAALELVMPARNPEDPCDDFEKLRALIEKNGGGAYVGCGPLPRFAIREVMESRQDRFAACLGRAKAQDDELRFTFHWTVKPDGSVHDVKCTAAPEASEAVRDCLAEAVGRLRFPRPMGGGTVELDWPFVFSR